MPAWLEQDACINLPTDYTFRELLGFIDIRTDGMQVSDFVGSLYFKLKTVGKL